TPPSKPVIDTDLTGKAGSTDPITVTAEPGSKVELFDKDGHKIGEGEADDQGHATITPTQPLPEGNVTAKATDKAEHPNTSESSDPVKVTDKNDLDGDGINNKDEEVAGTDPTNPDSDGNGTPDGDEDADNDGIPNKEESDPNGTTVTDKDNDGKPDITTPKVNDTDGDGIPDDQDPDIDG
ncbi:Ig-like domain-containing protein, partial [Mammaliicoccus stepanovicii]